MNAKPLLLGASTLLSLALALLPAPIQAQRAAPTRGDQQILGPGLYVFQMRILRATCEDADRTGHVTTFVAPIHGIPGHRQMKMELVNSQYWPNWELIVAANGHIVGTSSIDGRGGEAVATNRFELAKDGPRFVGRGSRNYTSTVGGTRRQCEVSYEALLRQLEL